MLCVFTPGTSNGDSQPNGDHVTRCSSFSCCQLILTCHHLEFLIFVLISVCSSCSQAESRQLPCCERGRCRAQVFSQRTEVGAQRGVSLCVLRGLEASKTPPALQTSSSNPAQTRLFTRSDIYWGTRHLGWEESKGRVLFFLTWCQTLTR